MATTSTQIRDLLWPGLNAIFGEHQDLPPQWQEIYEKNTSDKAYERDVEIKLTGLAQLRNEGQAITFEDMGERYSFTYKHVQIGLGFIITKIAMEDNQYKSQFKPSAKALKSSIAQTEEVYGAAVLNNANDTTGAYYGGDGVPLLSALHPIDVGTVANTPAVQAELNETSFQDAIIGIRRFRDAAGLRKQFRQRKVVVPVELQFTADRLFNTELRVGTTDNDINAIKGKLAQGYTVNDFITNPRSWYVLTTANDGLKYFLRKDVETDMYVDFATDNLQVKAQKRFSFGWSDFRGIYGCMP